MSSDINFTEHFSMNQTDTLIFPIGKLKTSCADRLGTVLHNYWFYTLVVHVFILYPIVIILMFKVISHMITRVRQFEDSTDHSRVIEFEQQPEEILFWQWPVMFFLLKEELKLLGGYLGAALLFTSLRHSLTLNTITWLVVMRWAIESFFAPYLLSMAFLLSYFVPWLADEDVSDFRLPVMYPREYYGRTIITVKVPLFILMRYAETCSSSSLNDLQIVISTMFCRRSTLI